MTNEKLCLSREEAANAIGISLPTLDAYLRRAEHPIPHIRAGRRIVIPLSCLMTWLEEESHLEVEDQRVEREEGIKAALKAATDFRNPSERLP